MSLSNCEVNLTLFWPDKCMPSNNSKATKSALTDRNLYFPILILSIQDNVKLLQQLKSKRTVIRNKYEPNACLYFLISSSLPRVN